MGRASRLPLGQCLRLGRLADTKVSCVRRSDPCVRLLLRHWEYLAAGKCSDNKQGTVRSRTHPQSKKTRVPIYKVTPDTYMSRKKRISSRLHELHESKLPFVSHRIYPFKTFDFFCSCMRGQCPARRSTAVDTTPQTERVRRQRAARLTATPST